MTCQCFLNGLEDLLFKHIPYASTYASPTRKMPATPAKSDILNSTGIPDTRMMLLLHPQIFHDKNLIRSFENVFMVFAVLSPNTSVIHTSALHRRNALQHP